MAFKIKRRKVPKHINKDKVNAYKEGYYQGKMDARKEKGNEYYQV